MEGHTHSQYLSKSNSGVLDISAEKLNLTLSDKSISNFTINGKSIASITGLTVWKKYKYDQYYVTNSSKFPTTYSYFYQNRANNMGYRQYTFNKTTGKFTLSNPVNLSSLSNGVDIDSTIYLPTSVGYTTSGSGSDIRMWFGTSTNLPSSQNVTQFYSITGWIDDDEGYGIRGEVSDLLTFVSNKAGAYYPTTYIEDVAKSDATAYPDNGVLNGFYYIKQ